MSPPHSSHEADIDTPQAVVEVPREAKSKMQLSHFVTSTIITSEISVFEVVEGDESLKKHADRW